MAVSTKLKTPKAILSYPHLDVPQKGEDGKPPKYSAALIFTPETLKNPAEAAFLKAMEQAAFAAIDAKWPGKRAELLASESFKKGFRRDATSKGYPEGSIYINVRGNNQPGCVYAYAGPDGVKPAVVPQDKIKTEFYAGSIVRASVSAFAYDNSGNKGVSFGLNNIQKLGDGARLDNRTAAEDDFVADLNAQPADLAGLI